MSLTKIKSKISFKRFGATVALGLLIAVKLTGVLNAQSVTQGYGSDEVMQRGMVVGLKADDKTKVRAINLSEIEKMLGVVVNANDSPITISSDKDHIFVATSGRHEVLVSDQAGEIKAGNYVTVSSLSGIAMKAEENRSHILGTAIDNFDGKSNALGTSVLRDSNNKESTVHIGRVLVELRPGKNPIAKNDNGAPAFLNRVGEAVTGKPVTALRLYLSAAIFIIGTITASAIIYAGIRSSIISIGRNPLSKHSILKSLLGVAITSLIVFIVSIIAVYLLLKL